MRTKNKKSRLKKGIIGFCLFTSFIVTLLIIYSISEYQKGLANNADGQEISDIGESTQEPFQGEEVQFGEIKILLIGSDARKEEQGRSDALMVGYYNQHTHEIKLASLMRDTYVDIPGYGMQKLNAAYSFGGPELVRKTIKHNFDLDINYFAIVNFTGFPKLVDLVAPEGIEVDIEKEMSTGIGMTLHPGKQLLDGNELLGYVRFRKDQYNDFGRVERQQEAIAKVLEEAVSVHNIVQLPKIVGTAASYVDTNIDSRILFTMGKDIIMNKTREMEKMRIPIPDSYTDQNVDVGAVLSINLEENKQALNEFFSGEAVAIKE
ncbi:LCP family protein [Lederbergia galactosidilytica]|uniref:Regulatory protein MsrR n=1 Tax=Lederbergia galactosidilytica TaxID=217031 RepID=A0A177ZK35_9BACI|nr:LCP family protein [Lederbergia galactosidilytica]OAK68175.1 transcriptional regulator [Lederbergia galactosidilytica]